MLNDSMISYFSATSHIICEFGTHIHKCAAELCTQSNTRTPHKASQPATLGEIRVYLTFSQGSQRKTCVRVFLLLSLGDLGLGRNTSVENVRCVCCGNRDHSKRARKNMIIVRHWSIIASRDECNDISTLSYARIPQSKSYILKPG